MILQVAGVSFRYDGTTALEDVTFGVRQHEIMAVLGPNGAGKTTLLRCINRILKPGAGTVFVGEQDLARFSRRQIARRTAYVAQWSEPVRLTAFDAVLLGRRPYIRWTVSEDDVRRTDAALKRLGLQDLALRSIDEMSGGEYQKVCIARAMVQEPTVMLLDEPTSSLDLKNQLSILRILREIVKEHEMCAVMSMHDLNTALRYADRFLFLKDGRVFAAVDHAGITAEIIQAVYGVPVEISTHQHHPVILPIDE